MEISFDFVSNCLNKSEGWFLHQGSYVRGYAYYGNKLIRNAELINALRNSLYDDKIVDVLRSLNGNFAAIINDNQRIILVVDKVRSIPILYTLKNQRITVSDSGILNNGMLKHFSANKLVQKEMASLGYISGYQTIVSDIFHVPAGHFVQIDKNRSVRMEKYHSYSQPKMMINADEFIYESHRIIRKSFDRIIGSLGDYSKIVIPLSGGYDSRLIACLCKEAGIKDVLCFTYGRKDSFEVRISKQVADQLGYEWHFVEYTEEVWKHCLESDEFKAFFEYAGNFTSCPHVQDFPALMYLKEYHLIDDGSVIIPGHSGDLLGGSKIPVEIMERHRNLFYKGTIKYRKEDLVNLIYNHFYDLNKLDNASISEIKKKISDVLCIEDRWYKEDEFLDIYECEWFNRARTGNFIVNSLRAYDYYNIRWRLPLWDEEFVNKWYSIPWKMKYYKKLYSRFLFDEYFKKYKVDIYKKEHTCFDSFKDVVKWILPEIIKIQIRRKNKDNTQPLKSPHFNSFEFVIEHMREKISKDQFPYITNYNQGNVNGFIALNYINLINSKLG